MLARPAAVRAFITKTYTGDLHAFSLLDAPGQNVVYADVDGNIGYQATGKVPIRAAFGRNIALSSCASMASLVLPSGTTAEGLPVGLEFDALSGGDRALLSLGLSLEAVLGRGKAAKI